MNLTYCPNKKAISHSETEVYSKYFLSEYLDWDLQLVLHTNLFLQCEAKNILIQYFFSLC